MSQDFRYFDLQLNGCHGVDFNADDLASDACHTVCEKLRADGVRPCPGNDHYRRSGSHGGSVGKDCSDPPARSTGCRLNPGIHVEGPFLNPEPGYVGAHPREMIRPADLDAMKRLVDAAEGLVRIVTLAPNSTRA